MESINPYTSALNAYLANLDKPPEKACHDPGVVQFIANMIQGRMLNHFVKYVSSYYRIEDETFERELTTLLVKAFSDELFETFRCKITTRPELVFSIATNIVRTELDKKVSPANRRRNINHYFLSILRQYLGFYDINDLLTSIQANPEIQKLVMMTYLRKHFNRIIYGMARFIISQDKEDRLTQLFVLFGKNVYPQIIKHSKKKNPVSFVAFP